MASAHITRRGLLGHAAGAYAAIGLAGSAAVASRSIADLFAEWLDPASYERYRDLQEQIVTATPETVQDLAIQMFVETDGGDSEWTPDFFDRIAALAHQ